MSSSLLERYLEERYPLIEVGPAVSKTVLNLDCCRAGKGVDRQTLP
jgi:hypothetical protein